MSSDYLFMCINDYNSGKAISIPFEVSNTANAFIVAQAVHERSEGYLYFSEALDYVSNINEKDELFGMPFGYDGSYRTAYLERCYVCVRDEWNPLHLEDMKFKPFEYVIVNGKPSLNNDYIFNKDDLVKDIISQHLHSESQKMVEAVGGFDVYFSKGFERYDYESNRKILEDLFAENDKFTLGDLTIEHNLTINTFEELIEVFPDYVEYATKYKDEKFYG
mgnify:FL=1